MKVDPSVGVDEALAADETVTSSEAGQVTKKDNGGNIKGEERDSRKRLRVEDRSLTPLDGGEECLPTPPAPSRATLISAIREMGQVRFNRNGLRSKQAELSSDHEQNYLPTMSMIMPLIDMLLLSKGDACVQGMGWLPGS